MKRSFIAIAVGAFTTLAGLVRYTGGLGGLWDSVTPCFVLPFAVLSLAVFLAYSPLLARATFFVSLAIVVIGVCFYLDALYFDYPPKFVYLFSIPICQLVASVLLLLVVVVAGCFRHAHRRA